MGLERFFPALLAGVTLSQPQVVPGSVTVKYDRFKDETTIQVHGLEVTGQPVLQLLDSFPGRKPPVASVLEIGFFVPNGCPFPNFLADGVRVKPIPSQGATGIDMNPYVGTLGGLKRVYTYVFNFYRPAQAEQIAHAKSVKYEICDKVYSLSPQDQSYLRQALSYYHVSKSPG